MEETEEKNKATEVVGDKIREFIAREFLYDRPEISLHDELQLFEGGIIDSMGIIRLINFIRDEFAVEINPEDVLLENFQTITRIRAMIGAALESNEQGNA